MKHYQNHASNALALAAQEVERLESIVSQSEKYFAFLLLGSGSVSAKYQANEHFSKAVRSGNICIIQNLAEDGHEFTLGIRDGQHIRAMTADERAGFLSNEKTSTND